MTSRGIRNNNPGNIRHSADKWQGAADIQSDESFVTFKSPEFGIRAMARILLKYQARGIDTVGEIISTYAPPVENDTGAYVKAVCRGCGVLPDDKIGLDDAKVMLPLIKAIIQHENGSQPYSDAVVLNGLRLAGIIGAEPKPLSQSRTTQGGTVVTAGGGLVVAAEVSRQLQTVQDAIQPGLDVMTWLRGYGVWVAAAVIVAGGLWILWSRYQDRQQLGH